MAIIFQCERCEQNIEVADELGGRMGQCPHCGHDLYVPLAGDAQSEPLDLTEIDPAEESRIQEELEQSRRTMQRIWSDRASAKAGHRERAEPVMSRGQRVKPIDPEDAAMSVEQYVLAMAHGSLEEAEALAAHLLGNPQTVNPIIKKAMNEGLSNPSLQNVPEAVQKGFLKKLLEYLNYGG